jgi:hypothetical protein
MGGRDCHLSLAHARKTSMLEFAQGLLEISSILGQFVLEGMLMPLELLLYLRNSIPNLRGQGCRRASEDRRCKHKHRPQLERPRGRGERGQVVRQLGPYVGGAGGAGAVASAHAQNANCDGAHSHE